MKKLMIIMVTGMVAMTALSGCGKESTPVAGTTTEAAAQTTESAEEEMSLSAGASEVLDSIEDDIMKTEGNSSESVYHDPNGWSIRYDANLFTVNQSDNNVFIVYTGESAGTNMITVTYTAEDKGEAAVKKLGESWGSDKTTYSEAPFLGNEEVTGYWAILDPEKDGSGAYETAIGRDYMDGALIFDISGHNGNDEEQNMAVSDALSGIIDSITFDQY